ncbi:hypothetical protein DBV15_00588 [Temnothorax longispinosus]|uniref:Uncharacterized protein n=1 Tax=Temnothorax longispinosus TaxID=300112 RepID=A0A4S2KXX9_9HYME|nr:hypothetical protein DBV15_00588 [Temnothorax longispinosus]
MLSKVDNDEYILGIPFYIGTQNSVVILLDKTDNPDDPDAGRQVGAFLTVNSWKRLLHQPPLTWTERPATERTFGSRRRDPRPVARPVRIRHRSPSFLPRLSSLFHCVINALRALSAWSEGSPPSFASSGARKILSRILQEKDEVTVDKEGLVIGLIKQATCHDLLAHWKPVIVYDYANHARGFELPCGGGGGGDLSRGPWYVVLARVFVYDGRKALSRTLREHERNETRAARRNGKRSSCRSCERYVRRFTDSGSPSGVPPRGPRRSAGGEKRTDISVQCNVGDSNDDRNSSFAPLIIHGIALANVSGAACPHIRVCAQMSASGRSLDVGSRIYVWERKIIHHVRGHPKLAVVDGRCFGHRFSMDARVIKLMSVFD